MIPEEGKQDRPAIYSNTAFPLKENIIPSNDEIKDAIKFYREIENTEGRLSRNMKLLIQLAETYLEVSGELPDDDIMKNYTLSLLKNYVRKDSLPDKTEWKAELLSRTSWFDDWEEAKISKLKLMDLLAEAIYNRQQGEKK